MGEYAHVAAVALVVAAYGALLFVGGLLWCVGWARCNERVSKVGDAAVLVGLWADTVLVTANYWLFDWVGWLEVTVR